MGKYVLREGVSTFQGREYGPGETVELDDEQGKRLHELGKVDPAGSADKAAAQRRKAADEQSKAEQEAEKAAAEHEDRKVAAAEKVRAAQSTPTPIPPSQPVSKR